MTISELKAYSDSDFECLKGLVFQLNPSLSLTRETLDRMMRDPNSHLYVARDGGIIVGCAALCVFHQPFETDANIESVVVAESYRGKGYGRMLVEHLIEEARKQSPISLHLTSRPSRAAANELYRSLGFAPKQTNVYVMSL